MEIIIAREPIRLDTRSATFYFANLGADVARCAGAIQHGDDARYDDSRSRARSRRARDARAFSDIARFADRRVSDSHAVRYGDDLKSM